jgi:hypothetical protein
MNSTTKSNSKVEDDRRDSSCPCFHSLLRDQSYKRIVRGNKIRASKTMVVIYIVESNSREFSVS